MFTVIAWNEKVTTYNAYQNLAGAKDQHVRVDEDIIYCPPLNKLVFASARGPLLRGRLESPSLRRLAYLHINPSENTAVSILYPAQVPIMFQGDSPLTLSAGEGIEAKTYSPTVGVEFATILAGLADGPLRPVTGEIWTIRATATPTLVESEWANAEIDFEPTLPVGKYQLVGALCSGTDISAFRFVPIGSMYRPGGVALAGNQMSASPMFRKGGIGVWCEFDSLTPPSVDVLGQSAGSQGVVLFLDLIKIA